MKNNQLRMLARKLGYPPPECSNEENILIEVASGKLGYPLPECDNEEKILLRRYGIRG